VARISGEVPLQDGLYGFTKRISPQKLFVVSLFTCTQSGSNKISAQHQVLIRRNELQEKFVIVEQHVRALLKYLRDMRTDLARRVRYFH